MSPRAPTPCRVDVVRTSAATPYRSATQPPPSALRMPTVEDVSNTAGAARNPAGHVFTTTGATSGEQRRHTTSDSSRRRNDALAQ